ncbi:MAG: hypothetical protein QW261_09305 [Candidatus Jordarchaeaceae archaeon]
MDTLRKWLAAETTIEALEKKNNSGYMRCIKFIETGRKPIKVSLDFVEGEVTGRTIKDTVRIDEKFVLKSQKTRIKISKKEIEVRVPSYTDYFILKIVSRQNHRCQRPSNPNMEKRNIPRNKGKNQ